MSSGAPRRVESAPVPVRRMLLIPVGLVLAIVAACSGDDPLVEQDGPPSTVAPTVAVSSPTRDGRPADPALVAAVIERLTDPALADAPVGEPTVRRFYATQLLALGLTDTEASCAADALVAAAGPDAARFSMADLMGQAVVERDALTRCVTADRLSALADQPPDPDRLAPEEVRSLLSDQSVAGLRAAGLTAEEAGCVASATVGALDDAEVQALLGGTGPVPDLLPEAVAGCLTAARLAELGSG